MVNTIRDGHAVLMSPSGEDDQLYEPGEEGELRRLKLYG
jgi:hypothetical protein